MELVERARQHLNALVRSQPARLAPEREDLMAFATLTALVEHFPSLALAKDSEVLLLAKWIRDREPDRFYKQRRIAISILAESFAKGAR